MDAAASLIWTGSELGYLKSVDSCNSIVKNYGEGDESGRLNAPTVLAWKDTEEQSILLGTKSGKIRTFSIETETFNNDMLDCGESSIVSVMVHDDNILGCHEKGAITVWNGDEIKLQKQIGDDIRVVKQNQSKKNFIATGGKENNLKLFDVERLEKPIFMAKNVRNDSLDLRQPVWVTDIEFLDNDESKIIVSTGYHKIRFYDTRKQRRPIDEIAWEDCPITSISMAANGNDLIVGNTTGSMASIDIRKKQENGSFRGIAGSISAIECHASQGFVSCACIDRFLRIYDVKTRELLQKFYLKSRLNCVLLSDKMYGEELCGKKTQNEQKEMKKQESQSERKDDEAQDDEIWNEMQLATDETKSKSKKKKLTEAEGVKKKKKKSF